MNPALNRTPCATPRRLSAKDYLFPTLLDIVAGALLLAALVAIAPRLVQADILNEFFYIVVIVWGLISALVLFGVMNSYVHKQKLWWNS